ncbi:MAG: disulfide bond formation protein B [Sphingomonadaceae bacterium]
MTPFRTAQALALAVPTLLMAGAWGSQYLGGLVPCEMCVWQRWPHLFAIGIAVLGFILPKRPVIALAAIAIGVSGAIGAFHAGVEYHWWEGLTRCSQLAGNRTITDIMNTPLVRCDEAQWTLFGISLAGYNALLSISAGLVILALLGRKRHEPS